MGCPLRRYEVSVALVREAWGMKLWWLCIYSWLHFRGCGCAIWQRTLYWRSVRTVTPPPSSGSIWLYLYIFVDFTLFPHTVEYTLFQLIWWCEAWRDPHSYTECHVVSKKGIYLWKHGNLKPLLHSANSCSTESTFICRAFTFSCLMRNAISCNCWWAAFFEIFLQENHKSKWVGLPSERPSACSFLAMTSWLVELVWCALFR